ncbi:type IV toxin-antitoxin system AbiEi family antitoxin domain-containing protein [Williamsia maris]|uniref:DUF559 domain-containing protein n=1 Tax=Williamsia maris TaxID=72806 RepID=A0ABT1HAU4_9NOCA|nr:type IV toxin-antitoxin system AbiEi family antitoxin domain-containing protein [Williamsia maris]MCP2175309.1 Protein of unknown function (DUF559) [Williamsia maris]
MTSLEQLVARASGVVTRRQLDEIGVGETEIRTLLRHGTLRRLRHGWYATPFADPTAVRAVTAGGVLTCLDALHRHGVWIPEHSRGLHLRPPARGARISSTRACRAFGDVDRARSAVDDVPTAIRHAARCLDHEGFVVVCDSALNSGLVTIDELRTSLATAPQHIHASLDRCDGKAQSGTETMVRLRLRSKNIAVTTQHHVPSVGHVDLLVGDRLVIEVDSVAHHTGVERYESDRTRDRELIRLGYLPLRFTYRQVVHDWASCETTVIDLVRRRRHLWRHHNRR